MPVREFEVEVVRTDLPIVRIDTDLFDEAAMAEFRQQMFPFTTIEQHVRHIAQYVVRFGAPKFIEGYGFVKYDGKAPKIYNDKGEHIGEEETAFGIDIEWNEYATDVGVEIVRGAAV